MGKGGISSQLLRHPCVAGTLVTAALGNTAYETYQNNKLRQEERKKLNDYFEPRIAAAQQEYDSVWQKMNEIYKRQRSYGQALENNMQEMIGRWNKVSHL